MATWPWRLIPVLAAAAVLFVPLLTGPAYLPAAENPHADKTCPMCAVAERSCCGAPDGDGPACCRRPDAVPAGVDQDSDCDTCPLGGCDCCQALHGVTLACFPLTDQVGARRPLSAPLLTVESLLFSRSDEPLLPPPIA